MVEIYQRTQHHILLLHFQLSNKCQQKENVAKNANARISLEQDTPQGPPIMTQEITENAAQFDYVMSYRTRASSEYLNVPFRFNFNTIPHNTYK